LANVTITLIVLQYLFQVAGQVHFRMAILEQFVIAQEAILTQEFLGIQMSTAAVLVVQENILITASLVVIIVDLVPFLQVWLQLIAMHVQSVPFRRH
jgi:hypothetical protein